MKLEDAEGSFRRMEGARVGCWRLDEAERVDATRGGSTRSEVMPKKDHARPKEG